MYEKLNKLYKEVNMDKHKGKYMWTVTVGEKGQIVIPKQARDIFDIKPGDSLIILADEERGIAIPPKSQFEVIYKNILGGYK